MEKLIKPQEALKMIENNAKTKLDRDLKTLRTSFNTSIKFGTHKFIHISGRDIEFSSLVKFKDELEELGYTNVKIRSNGGSVPHEVVVEL